MKLTDEEKKEYTDNFLVDLKEFMKNHGFETNGGGICKMPTEGKFKHFSPCLVSIALPFSGLSGAIGFQACSTSSKGRLDTKRGRKEYVVALKEQKL